MKRILIALFSIVIVAAAGFTWYRSQSTQEDTLTVGMLSGYPPFMTINAAGEFEGFDVDVAREIAQKLNKKLVIKDMSLASLLLALQQNKLDLVLSGLGMTGARLEKMNMIHYCGNPRKTGYLVFWQKAPSTIKTIEDLKQFPDAVICVEPGSWQEDFLVEYPFLSLKNMSAMSDIVMDLKFGQSFAAFLDPDIVPSLQAKSPELKVVEIPLNEKYQSAGNGIAINKNNQILTADIARIVNDLKKDNTLKRLENRWFKGGA